MINRRLSTMALVLAALGCGPSGPTYDLVIENGRVIDPETDFFQVASVGIMGDTIAAISEAELRGERVIDATGMVVAPGFVDLHEHGQSEEAHGLMVRDGVTTALELETDDVDQWYAAREGGQLVKEFLTMIEEARAAGQDVTTETYPYGAGMTEITSALFDDWESWPDERFADHQLVSTGERMTRESFAKAREAGGTVIIHSRTEEMTRTAVAHPLTIIASDGFIEDGRGHPRTSGSYSKVLERAPAFARKGRLQEGMDADITVFDPATVIDRSTYTDATIPAEGIPYVVVGGVVVVDQGALTEARPGEGVRAPTR